MNTNGVPGAKGAKAAIAGRAQHCAQQAARMMTIATAVVLAALVLMTVTAFAAPTKERLEELKTHPYHGYSIIIQIDKAPSGEALHAQRVRVHRYNPDTKSVEFIARWDASTGMEVPKEDKKGRLARRQTHAGYYNIEFLEIDAYSDSWDGPMPYAMYWDYNQGFAIHATEWFAYFKLGSRASAGCTRLHADNAISLFEMIKSMGKNHSYKLDRETGKPVRDANGNPVIQWTYQAMVLIEDHGTLEPTRFGFVDRDVVFASKDSYLEYMQPVAYGQSYPVNQRPVLDLQNLEIPTDPESVSTPDMIEPPHASAPEGPQDPPINPVNVGPSPAPQTQNLPENPGPQSEASNNGQGRPEPSEDPQKDPMFLENALLETDSDAAIQ